VYFITAGFNPYKRHTTDYTDFISIEENKNSHKLHEFSRIILGIDIHPPQNAEKVKTEILESIKELLKNP